MKHTGEIVVERPRSEVFRFLADPTRAPSWMRWVVQGAHAEPWMEGVGSRTLLTIRRWNFEATIELIVTGYEVDRLLELELEVPGIKTRCRYSLVDVAAGTQVRAELDVDFWRLRIPLRIFGWLLGPIDRRNLRREMAALKMAIETEHRTRAGGTHV